ncbi:hypothetical protein KMP11_05740 [Gemella sp. zg-570]|uniref:hypothetical protein n=1 Tax=Gemella sp. zg-570 TaxID=2840371 RepID=UPI001C0B6481|nr:hypothetical protein [Gemella sp. zg-570]QWQ38455.1 hypothetical protein KMP11_05740 [Gemella sp. zg-570]
MKIRNAKGRTDGNSGYTRTLGNEELGKLISKVQATVISNGTELERIIVDKSNKIEDIDYFIEQAIISSIDNGVYLCTKKVFKKSKKYSAPLRDKEPDLLIFIVENNRICKVIELKDGDAFDTKKSRAEKENLEEFSMKFGAKIPFATDYYICSFNQENKDVIKSGFKGVFDEEHIMTGRELCELLKIDYEEIINKRKNDMEDNFEYFIDELIKISEVVETLKMKLK